MQLLEILGHPTDPKIKKVLLGADDEEEQDTFDIHKGVEEAQLSSLFSEAQIKFPSISFEKNFFYVSENELLGFVDFLKEKGVFVSGTDRDLAFGISNNCIKPSAAEGLT